MSDEVDEVLFPAWIREIQTLLPAYPHFVISGHVHDQYLVPNPNTSDGRGLSRLPRAVAQALTERGIRLVLSYEVTTGTTVLTTEGDGTLGADGVAALIGRPLSDCPGPADLAGLAELIRTLAGATGRISEPVGLIVESASRLTADPSRLTDPEFDFFRAVERACRTARPVAVPAGHGQLHSPVIWVVDSDRDLPPFFTNHNTSLRIVAVGLPDSEDRETMARRRLEGGDGDASSEELQQAVEVLAAQTAGMELREVQNVTAVAKDQGLALEHIEDAARAYRVGITDNPWRAKSISERLRDELAGRRPMAGTGQLLTERVQGQQAAVAKSLDILIRSVTGLTSAHSGPSTTRPRGVMFFAGPTGVGKTEMAKSLTRLLLDDERFYIRFDMSEFSEEHAAQRLIGAPPGYVGHNAGGELTNAIRERPFSIVLFDEIEKADPSILDKFLQVLDDGRLTDGRGETVYFTEAVIIFTSNLGIYHEVRDTDGRRRRELSITPENPARREDRAAVVSKAIEDHFTLELGRPELLNRIGKDNIVYFDFISPDVAEGILRSMLANIADRVQQEHGWSLELTDDTMQRVRETCVGADVLEMGGRGIGSKLETVVINPLARLVLTDPPPQAAGVERVDLRMQDDIWVARWA